MGSTDRRGGSDSGETFVPDALIDPAAGESVPEGYDDLGPIASGAMGEVHRIRDRRLGRLLAVKVLRPELRGSAEVASRFVEEARLTAGLAHPGVIPVHELGTLHEVIQRAHTDRPPGALRRLIDALHHVCETVAYAHTQGVVHRDLKPANLMVGDFGEVVVMRDSHPGRPRMVPVSEFPVDESLTACATRAGTSGSGAATARPRSRGTASAWWCRPSTSGAFPTARR